MPSLRQVQAHYEMLDTLQAREEERRQKQQLEMLAAQGQQQYGMQTGLQQQAAGIQQQRDQSQFQYQQAHSQQQFGQQQQLNEQHVDLQARYNEIQLGQAENMRMQRLKQAISGVESNADLSPQERGMLITQLQSGLNPLENRQREAGMLFQTLQSRALEQQTAQQGQLFGQRQQWLANGVQNALQTIVDPDTGARTLVHVGPDGTIQQMDFSGAQEDRRLRATHVNEQVLASQQQRSESAAMMPGRLTGQDLGNQTTQQNLDQLRALAPHQVQQAALHTQQIVQSLLHGEDSHRVAMQLAPVHLASVLQQLDQNIEQQPFNLDALRARVSLLQEQVAQAPNAAAHTLAQTSLTNATTALTRARTAELNRETAGTPGTPEQHTQLQQLLGPHNLPAHMRNEPIGAQLQFAHGMATARYQQSYQTLFHRNLERVRAEFNSNRHHPVGDANRPEWMRAGLGTTIMPGGNRPTTEDDAIRIRAQQQTMEEMRLNGQVDPATIQIGGQPAGQGGAAAPAGDQAAAIDRLRAVLNPQGQQQPFVGARPPGMAEVMEQQQPQGQNPPARPWWMPHPNWRPRLAPWLER